MFPSSATDRATRTRRDRVETHGRRRSRGKCATARPVESLEGRTLMTAVTGLTLYNANTDQPVGELTPGMVVDFAAIGTRNLNIVASVDDTTRSVRFAYDGNTNYRTESSAPLAIGGDEKGGDLRAWTPTLGKHTLWVIPYSGSSGTGSNGRPLAVSFVVVDNATPVPPPPPPPPPTGTAPVVTGLTLYNAATDQPIRALTNGAVLDFAQLGTDDLSVVASTNAATESVRFGLDGNSNFMTENAAPYAIASETGLADLNAWTPSLGDHTLRVTPYAGNAATGTAGAPVTVAFRVQNTTTPPNPNPNPDPNPNPNPNPNPTPIPPDTNPNPSNRVPSVNLIDAPSGRRAGPGYFALRAGASDSDGTVQKVEFYANGLLVSTANAAPFTAPWVEVQPGSYSVVAKAYDDDGGSKTSSASSVTIVRPSGDTIYVSPGGSDGNPGSSSRPVKTIGKGASLAGPGDTVLVKNGNYSEELKLRKGGTIDNPLTIRAESIGGVTVDSSGKTWALTADGSAAKWIDVVGLNFKNTNNTPGGDKSAVKTADGWRLFDVTVERVKGNGIGMFGEHVAVVRSTARHNGNSGIGGSSVRNALLYDSKSHGNNTGEHSGSFEGGGGKFTRVRSMLVEKYESWDNNGPGLWFDYMNINVAVRNSEFHHNKTLRRSDGREKIGGTGILFEISGVHTSDGEGALLADNNLFHDNDGWSFCVYASRNVKLLNNTMLGDAIELKDGRESPFYVEDLSIVGNRLKNAHIVADRPTASGYQNEGFVIDGNTYDNGGGTLIKWVDRQYKSISDIRSSLGFERNGRTGSI